MPVLLHKGVTVPLRQEMCWECKTLHLHYCLNSLKQFSEVVFVLPVICCITKLGGSNTITQSSMPVWVSLTNFQDFW